MNKFIQNISLAAVLLGVTPLALADNRVWGDDQDVSSGTVTAKKIHADANGMKTGIFEYTLGAKEDGPIRVDGKLVMVTVTAK